MTPLFAPRVGARRRPARGRRARARARRAQRPLRAVAARFTAAGLAVRALDLRGHGRSPGAARRDRFEPAGRRHRRARPRCGERGVPVFVYGHSLGALIAALWLRAGSRRRRSRARSLSAIGLHSALREQAAKVRAARVLGRVAAEGAREVGHRPGHAVARSRGRRGLPRRQARPRHRLARLRPRRARGDRRDRRRARRGWRCRCSSSTAGRTSRLRVGRARAGRARAVGHTLHVYDGAVPRDPPRARARPRAGDVLAWIEARLASASSPS